MCTKHADISYPPPPLQQQEQCWGWEILCPQLEFSLEEKIIYDLPKFKIHS